MSDFERDMANMSSGFDNAEASEFGEDFPDGQYVAVVNTAVVKQSQAGRWQVSWDLTIVWDSQGSKYRNRHMWFHEGITVFKNGKHTLNDVGIGIIKKKFQIMGIPVSNVTVANMKTICASVTNKVVAVTQSSKKNSDFLNYRFDGLLAQDLSQFTPPKDANELKMRLAGINKNPAPGQAILPTQMQQAAPTSPVAPLQFEE